MKARSKIIAPNSGEQSWIQGGPYRLGIRTFESEDISENPVLMVVIHGDAPFNEPEYQYVFAGKVAMANSDVVAVGLLRPGYTDPQGNRSDGERGESVGDSINVINTEAIADAIDGLRGRWNARKVVVAAHSGGAALAANILNRHPSLIDHALLVSSIYDVERWRAHMFERTGESIFHGNSESLSPIEQITEMSNQVEVILMVGTEDEVAPPNFSEQYEIAARKHGKRVRLVRIEGEDHEIFLKQAVFVELGPMLK